MFVLLTLYCSYSEHLLGFICEILAQFLDLVFKKFLHFLPLFSNLSQPAMNRMDNDLISICNSLN
jgi:hypothetical protein